MRLHRLLTCLRATLLLVPTLLVGAALLAAPAFADDAKAAGEAYRRGSEAFTRKDYPEAAASFAAADALAPNPVALESAIKAAVLADDGPLVMTLVDRAATRSTHPSLTATAALAREKYQDRVARIRLECAAGYPCTARVDGRDLVIGRATWMSGGPHEVTFTSDGATQQRKVELTLGQMLVVTAEPPKAAPAAPYPTPVEPPKEATPSFTAPPPPPKPAATRRSGASPVFVVIGSVATAALLGVTVWSGVDTLELHDEFEAGDGSVRDAGITAQLRTNILLGATGLSAAGVVVTAVFTDWGGDEPPQTGGYRGLAVRGVF